MKKYKWEEDETPDYISNKDFVSIRKNKSKELKKIKKFKTKSGRNE